MANAPINVAQFEAQARAQAAAQQRQQQQPQYGQPPGGPPAYGAPPGAPPPPYGQPQQQPYAQPPAQAYGQPPAGYGQPQPQGPYGQPQAPYGQPPAQGPYGQPPYGAPGYGQPAGQPQGGTQAPQIGIGGFGPGGIPRINFKGGDFSPTKIVNVIVKGDGYESPRRMGALFIGAAMAFYIINTVLIFAHLYYSYFYSLGAIIWWAGWWLLIFGQPRKTADGSPSAMWGRIGLAVCLAFGLLSAFGTAFSMRTMAF
jgi:hypothetical protein